MFFCNALYFSTMLTGEGIDELAKFADKSEEVKALTRKAMGGNMSFRNSLEQRLGIIQPSLEMVCGSFETEYFLFFVVHAYWTFKM